MLRLLSSPAPRSFSGVDSLEADCREAAAPLLLASVAALWLAREAASAAFSFYTTSGRALWQRARTIEEAEAGTRVDSEGEGEDSLGGAGGVHAAPVPTPAFGVPGGGKFPSASLLLSSRRLLLLARSRRLFPEATWVGATWVATLVGPPTFAPDLNQNETSSVAPSVSNTSLAGIPLLLQHSQAKNWLCALGR
jgi:hypothetical protein